MNLSRSTSCLPFRASNRPLAPLCPAMQHRRIAVCAAPRDEGVQQSLWPSLKSVALSLAGAAILLSPTNALAVETVAPTQMMQYAKSLPKQQVDKGQVWTVFIGGAVALFLGTLALENNPAFFPAISKANKASAAAKEASEAEEKQISIEEAEAAEVLRQTAIVEQGLAEAKQRVLGTPPPASPRAQEPEVPEPAAASASRAEEAAQEVAQAGSAAGAAGAADAARAADAAGSEESAAKHARLASFVNSMAADGKQGALGSVKEKDAVKSL